MNEIFNHGIIIGYAAQADRGKCDGKKQSPPESHASAGVAQLVEQLIRNEKVGCSIHLSGTNKINDLEVIFASSGKCCHTLVTFDGIPTQYCATARQRFSRQFSRRHVLLAYSVIPWHLYANGRTLPAT